MGGFGKLLIAGLRNFSRCMKWKETKKIAGKKKKDGIQMETPFGGGDHKTNLGTNHCFPNHQFEWMFESIRKGGEDRKAKSRLKGLIEGVPLLMRTGGQNTRMLVLKEGEQGKSGGGNQLFTTSEKEGGNHQRGTGESSVKRDKMRMVAKLNCVSKEIQDAQVND